jgi:hypothetical protein
MKSLVLLCIVSFSQFVACEINAADGREWTFTADGGIGYFSFRKGGRCNADFYSLQGTNTVTLRMSDGTKVDVPFSVLSKEDQDYAVLASGIMRTQEIELAKLETNGVKPTARQIPAERSLTPYAAPLTTSPTYSGGEDTGTAHTAAVALILLSCWVVCGLVGQLIAKRRGSEEGFIVSFLLGPLGWLIVAMRPDTRRKCSQCLGVVPERATKCMHCGSDLPIQ